jgi:hypothetical protein
MLQILFIAFQIVLIEFFDLITPGIIFQQYGIVIFKSNFIYGISNCLEELVREKLVINSYS